jgi:zinc protease
MKQLDDISLIGSLKVERYQLDNGLQLAIVVDPSTPIFTYQTWFRTGSADEPAGRQGLAHLFEHMMFRKTTRREMGEFDRLVNLNGGTGLNAYTSRDQTVYFFTFPKDKLEIAADLEADRLVNLVIDDEMFSTEKGAVLVEKNRGLDDPVRYLWEEIYKIAYTQHNYKYSVIGETESIKSFSVGEARDFYADFYSPNNALIIIAGDVDPAEVTRVITEQYAATPSRSPRRRTVTAEPAQTSARSATVTHPKATQSMMGKVWHIPDMTNADYPALMMAGKLLAAGKSSLLYERLISTSKVTEALADPFIGRDMGTFEFFAQLADESSFTEIEDITGSALRELARGDISEDQIQIARNNIQRDVYQSATVPSGLGQKLGDSFIYTGDLGFEIRTLAGIENVSRGDVQRVAERYFRDGNCTTVYLEPGA